MNVRVLLVDDHPLLRNGLRLLLEAQPDITVVGEASDGDGAIAAAAQFTPDVVVMDIEMPGANGVDVTSRVLSVSPASRVIVLSAFPDAHYVRAAVQAGARGYLLKGNAPAEVLNAVRAVVAGHSFMSPEATSVLVEALRDALATGPAPTAPPLSPREREVMTLVVEGCRTKEIAARLGIGTKTVDTHRARLMKKLGCGSTAELVRHAIREGFVR